MRIPPQLFGIPSPGQESRPTSTTAPSKPFEALLTTSVHAGREAPPDGRRPGRAERRQDEPRLDTDVAVSTPSPFPDLNPTPPQVAAVRPPQPPSDQDLAPLRLLPGAPTPEIIDRTARVPPQGAPLPSSPGPAQGAAAAGLRGLPFPAPTPVTDLTASTTGPGVSPPIVRPEFTELGAPEPVAPRTDVALAALGAAVLSGTPPAHQPEVIAPAAQLPIVAGAEVDVGGRDTVDFVDQRPATQPKVSGLEARQRAFGLDELGLTGQGLKASPVAEASDPARGEGGAPEWTLAVLPADLTPSPSALSTLAPVPGAASSLGAPPGQTLDVRGGQTSTNAPPDLAAARINGPLQRPTSSRGRSDAPEPSDPLDAFDHAEAADLSRRWPNQSKTSASANLVLSEVEGEILLVAVAPGVDAQVHSRLQKMAAEIVADHGLTLVDFTLNGSAIKGSSVTRLGTQNGNRAR